MIESPSAVRWVAQRVGQTPHRRSKPGEVLSFTELLVDGCGEEEREGEMQKAPSSENLTPGAISLMAVSGATGFEPAIFALTGQYVRPLHHAPCCELYDTIGSQGCQGVVAKNQGRFNDAKAPIGTSVRHARQSLCQSITAGFNISSRHAEVR